MVISEAVHSVTLWSPKRLLPQEYNEKRHPRKLNTFQECHVDIESYRRVSPNPEFCSKIVPNCAKSGTFWGMKKHLYPFGGFFWMQEVKCNFMLILRHQNGGCTLHPALWCQNCMRSLRTQNLRRTTFALFNAETCSSFSGVLIFQFRDEGEPLLFFAKKLWRFHLSWDVETACNRHNFCRSTRSTNCCSPLIVSYCFVSPWMNFNFLKFNSFTGEAVVRFFSKSDDTF